MPNLLPGEVGQYGDDTGDYDYDDYGEYVDYNGDYGGDGSWSVWNPWPQFKYCDLGYGYGAVRSGFMGRCPLKRGTKQPRWCRGKGKVELCACHQGQLAYRCADKCELYIYFQLAKSLCLIWTDVSFFSRAEAWLQVLRPLVRVPPRLPGILRDRHDAAREESLTLM